MAFADLGDARIKRVRIPGLSDALARGSKALYAKRKAGVRETMPLSRDATIASVVADLKKPEAYLRGVLENFYKCGKPDLMVVRIGTTGRGRNPHYKFESPPPDPFPNVLGNFRGDNHKPLVDDDFLRDGNWSSKTMTFSEVKALLKKVLELRHI